MKKVLSLLILGSVSLLHADYYNSECTGQGYTQQGYQQGYQNQAGNYQQGYQDQGQRYNQQNYPSQRYQDNQGQFQQNTNNSNTNLPQMDQRLTNQIQDMLNSNDNYTNVTVKVNNGYVTLTGTVGLPNDRNFLEQKIHKISGVQGVDNQITVKNNLQNNNQNQTPKYNWNGSRK